MTDRLSNRQWVDEEISIGKDRQATKQTWSGMFRRCARNLLGPPDMVRNVPKMCQKSPWSTMKTWSGMFRRCARNLLCPPDMVRNVPKMCQKSPMFCKHSWWKHEMFFECRQECFWSSQSCQESSAVFSGCHLSSLGPQTRIPRTFFRGWHTCSLGSQTRMPGTFLSSYKFSVLCIQIGSIYRYCAVCTCAVTYWIYLFADFNQDPNTVHTMYLHMSITQQIKL